MFYFTKTIRLVVLGLALSCGTLHAQDAPAKFHVIAFYTGKNDPAHISFVKEANRWFPETAAKYHIGIGITTSSSAPANT